MSKYKPLFMSEAGEHLGSLERDLLHIEQHPEDRGRIHEVFRHLHSLKSMAASMGYEPMSRLAHGMEDLVSPYQDSEEAIGQERVDALLKGLDLLRTQLDEISRDASLSPAGDDTFAGLERSERPVSTVPRSAKPLSAEAGSFEIEVVIAESSRLPAVRAFLALKRLGGIGRVIESRPDFQQLRQGQLAGRKLWLRLSTNMNAAAIREVLEGVPEIETFELHSEERAVQAAPAPSPTAVKASTVRVRTDLLDFFVDSVSELITLRATFDDLAERLDVPALREGVRRMGSVVRKLQDRIMEVRMVPASALTSRLPRVCRDVARSRGKQVRFSVEGEEVELDRALVESLDTPMLHLLRNAVDHGIESPDKRIASGKPAEGRIDMRIARQQDRIRIELSDDGGGIDPDEVLARARRAGWCGPQQTPPREEILEYVFRPGFSTRDSVTDTSGRGVGLDAVRNALDGLQGRVSVRSEPGQGTTFSLDLPLTLAILQVLLVRSGDVQLALPASRVLRASSLRPGMLVEQDGGLALFSTGLRLPFVALAELLGDRAAAVQARGEVVLVGREEPVLALGLDRITGHRETVLKSAGRLLRAIGPYSAATVLGDGQPVLILDVDELIARDAKRRRQRGEGEPG
ncbi:MAG: chemotaxis protein CheA [Deltaproteobacteria bacterium]|nr:chemotaxis protein CheA [Deltaproteobacteria bacterium]